VKPHPKVVTMTLAAAVATVYAALSKGTGDPLTIGAAILTLAQFAVGYLTPASKIPKALTARPWPEHFTSTYEVIRGVAFNVHRYPDGHAVYVRRPAPRRPARHALLIMDDSVDVSQIPGGAVAVAGYVGGRWPTFRTLLLRFRHAAHISIAVNSSENADILDIEAGDATPAEAPAWVSRQRARGQHLPGVYHSLSGLQDLLDLLARAGIPRQSLRVWSAHYTGSPHLCGPACGFGLRTVVDATQYTDHALHRNLDASLVTQRFLEAG
jgi:hypothetical protein